MAALESGQAKGVKRKHDNNDNTFSMFQNLLTGAASNENGFDDYDCNDNDDDSRTSWINHYIKQPYGERGRTDTDDRCGFGKAEILEVADITNAQYRCYMVCFLPLLQSSSLTSFHPEICTPPLQPLF